jgi:hypothetical protein
VIEAQETDNFNERLLKLICLNQAIDKVNKEMQILTNTRDQVLLVMEENVETENFQNLLNQMRANRFVPNAVNNNDPRSYSETSSVGPIENQHHINENFEQSKLIANIPLTFDLFRHPEHRQKTQEHG